MLLLYAMLGLIAYFVVGAGLANLVHQFQSKEHINEDDVLLILAITLFYPFFFFWHIWKFFMIHLWQGYTYRPMIEWYRKRKMQ